MQVDFWLEKEKFNLFIILFSSLTCDYEQVYPNCLGLKFVFYQNRTSPHVIVSEFVTSICREYLRGTIEIGVGKLIHQNSEMLCMVLAMLYQARFYNYCFQSMVMEVVGGLNLVLTVLSSKLTLSGSLKRVTFLFWSLKDFQIILIWSSKCYYINLSSNDVFLFSASKQSKYLMLSYCDKIMIWGPF